MASTFTAGQAFDYAKTMVKSMPLEKVQVQILDAVNKIMWMAAPWRWTIGNFPNIDLLDNTQDYTVTLPDDFMYLIAAYITDQANGLPRPLALEPFLPLGGLRGQPNRLTIILDDDDDADDIARVSPVPGTVPDDSTIISLYKKNAPTIEPNNINTEGILLIPNEWKWVFDSGVLYYAYLFGDDQRAGGAQIDPGSGKITFTGQRGVFEANIQQMKEREKLLTINPPPEGQKDAK